MWDFIALPNKVSVHGAEVAPYLKPPVLLAARFYYVVGAVQLCVIHSAVLTKPESRKDLCRAC